MPAAQLYLNAIPYVSWKGDTKQQITSVIKKNNKFTLEVTNTQRNLFLPQPLKIYRREIASQPGEVVCNNRISTSIDLLQMPNGYVVSDNTEDRTGLVNVMEAPTTTNTSDNGDCVISPSSRTNHAFVCQVENAKRRVRSSGIVKRAFKPENNNDLAYFTNTNQYLVSRNRTFKQNQYTHIRSGEAPLTANGTLYNSNTYSPNGLSHCKRVNINDTNNTFYYLWTTFNIADLPDILNSTPANFQNPTSSYKNCFRVVIPNGEYTVDELQNAFNARMATNYHYYINKQTGHMEFLLKIVFNTVNQKIELQCFSNFVVRNTTQYYLPSVNGINVGTVVSEPYKRPAFYFPANSGFAYIVGFQTSQSAFYPNIPTIGSMESDANIGFLSISPIHIFPFYDMVYFKPSNTKFATQGAVTASDRVLRVKYDTITKNGGIFQNTYGSGAGSAIAFAISENTYTIKDKLGFPNKKTPLFCKTTGEMKCSTR
jgi:hypothetical protein